MRRAEILYDNILSGHLTETDDGEYIFEYTADHINKFPSKFISFSFPVSSQRFSDTRLFPFFEGLIPEGWLLDIAARSWKLNPNDRMGLLLACCQDCIGAVSVIPVIGTDE